MKCSLLIALLPVLAVAQTNMIRNPSFEEVDANGFPAEWVNGSSGGSTAGRADIPSPSGQTCGFINKVSDGISNVAALAQKHVVEPNKEYLLSAMCKGHGTLFGYEYDKDNKWLRCSDSTSVNSDDWCPYSVRIKTSPNTTSFQVRFEIYDKGSEGKGWIDNVYFGWPPVPTISPDFTVEASGHNVILKWQGNPDHRYLVYRNRYPDVAADGNDFIVIKGEKAVTFIDDKIPQDWLSVSYCLVTCDNYNQISKPTPARTIVFPTDKVIAPVVWTDSVLNKVRRYGPRPAATPMMNLNLALAANDTDSRQILVQAGNAPLRNLDVKLSSLKDAKGNPVPEELALAAFETRYTMVSKVCDVKFGTKAGLIPDPLPPWRGAIDVPSEATQSIWIQASTKPGCPAGIYNGEVTLLLDGKIWQTLPLQIEVFGFELPVTPSFMSAFAISGNELAKGHDVAYNSPEYRKLYEKYYWFMTDHRMPPDDIPVDIFSPDAAKYLNDPRVNSFRVPSGWGKVDVPKLKKIADHIRANGWMKKGYVYCADEPPESRYPEVRKLSQEVHAAAADLQFLITEKPAKGLEGAIDIWCPVLSSVNWDKVNERREKGEHIWWYTCCSPKTPYPTFLVDDIGNSHRVLSWLQAKHNVEGVLYWSVNLCTRVYGKSDKTPSVWEDAALFPNTNGDGFLLYPGKQVGIDGPVTSVRLEIIRDGHEDFEYLVMLRSLLKNQTEFESFINPVITDFQNWTKDPNVLEQQRLRIARKILELKK